MAGSRLVRNSHVDRARVPHCEAPAPTFHPSLPGFAPTPVRAAPSAAARLGVARVLVKDESERMGMPSFKILGASWATYRAVLAKLGRRPGPAPSFGELREVVASAGRPLTLVAATDGNHGHAVAHREHEPARTAHEPVAGRLQLERARAARAREQREEPIVDRAHADLRARIIPISLSDSRPGTTRKTRSMPSPTW